MFYITVVSIASGLQLAGGQASGQSVNTVGAAASSDGVCTCLHIYRVSQEECAILRESVPYVKLYRYNPKHLYPKLNGYGNNGQRSLKL